MSSDSDSLRGAFTAEVDPDRKLALAQELLTRSTLEKAGSAVHAAIKRLETGALDPDSQTELATLLRELESRLQHASAVIPSSPTTALVRLNEHDPRLDSVKAAYEKLFYDPSQKQSFWRRIWGESRDPISALPWQKVVAALAQVNPLNSLPFIEGLEHVARTEKGELLMWVDNGHLVFPDGSKHGNLELSGMPYYRVNLLLRTKGKKLLTERDHRFLRFLMRGDWDQRTFLEELSVKEFSGGTKFPVVRFDTKERGFIYSYEEPQPNQNSRGVLKVPLVQD